ncbi:hypothetical protein ABZ990_13450 [Streptomyces sp. NPDC046203]|uniref:hypothetical protein n=1 Tax=Streptomyces sp. NPDC046203 TaxID=3154602 RepID=UPI0033E3C7E8
MLHPVDLSTVFAEDRVHGRHLTDIHPAVAWWIGSCLVLTTGAHGVALVHDGTEPAKQYCGLFNRGAVNCEHYTATVSVVGAGDEELLAYAIRTLQVPGARISAFGAEVTIRLFTADGSAITDGTGLERICGLIALDKVLLPVNDRARGRVVHRPDLAKHYFGAEG